MEFYATTPPGIEDIAAEEIANLCGAITDIKKDKGRIFFSASIKDIPKLNYCARCTERFVLLLKRGNLISLNDLYLEIKEIDFEFLNEKSFAIRSMRTGSHEFTSMDIARVAGQAVIDSFMEQYGKRLKVNLNNPDVIVRVDVIEDEYLVGIDTTGDSALHKRWWRVYNHPAHLNSTIAVAMLKLAEWKSGKSLLDPMCGSGTILIEAALMALGIAPGKNREFAFSKLHDFSKFYEFNSCEDKFDQIGEIRGIEKFRKHVEGAKRNAENAGVSNLINFDVGDVKDVKGSYECIVTNPPYGLRIARKGVIKKLYDTLCKTLKRCLIGKAVLITSEDKVMEKCLKENSLKVEHERYVKYGGLLTKIFVVTSQD